MAVFVLSVQFRAVHLTLVPAFLNSENSLGAECFFCNLIVQSETIDKHHGKKICDEENQNIEEIENSHSDQIHNSLRSSIENIVANSGKNADCTRQQNRPKQRFLRWKLKIEELGRNFRSLFQLVLANPFGNHPSNDEKLEGVECNVEKHIEEIFQNVTPTVHEKSDQKRQKVTCGYAKHISAQKRAIVAQSVLGTEVNQKRKRYPIEGKLKKFQMVTITVIHVL